jgi:hypothetical protein
MMDEKEIWRGKGDDGQVETGKAKEKQIEKMLSKSFLTPHMSNMV